MVNLDTHYLGLKLRNPLVASSSPLTHDVDNIAAMEAAGAGAVVLHSLFEEQIEAEARELDQRLNEGTESFAESLSYFPDLGAYQTSSDRYLDIIQEAKSKVAIPIIASLNGTTQGGWLDLAKRIEAAGADALEINLYQIATDAETPSAEVEARYLEVIASLVARVQIPVAVKIGDTFTTPVRFAKAVANTGAKGLVIFNRFYQPDFDLDRLEVLPSMSLSTPAELPLRLRWAAILDSRVSLDIAVSGGVHSGEGAVKSVLAGAKVAMMASALLKNGVAHIETVLRDMTQWLESREYASLVQARGSMNQKAVVDPAAFERANYIRVLNRVSGLR